MPDSPYIVHQPFLYDIGPIKGIGGFGLAILLCFVIGQILLTRELTRRGHDPAPVGDLVFAAVVGGLLGAKIYYAILVQDMDALFDRAGFVFWGGLIGGIIATSLVVRFKKLRWSTISDASALSLAAAYSVGRTGCWAVGDDYGRPWDSALAVQFPEGAPPSTAANMSQLFGTSFPAGTDPSAVIAVHPTQIYEVILGFVMFLIVWRFRDHRHAAGWLFGLYAVLAGIERFVIEFVRAKDDRFFGGLTLAQMIALGFVAAGVAWMYSRRDIGPGKPGIYAS